MDLLTKYDNNINYYKYYKMFAYDWLFYRAISIIYLTITKGINMSQIMIINAFFSIFSVIWMYFSNYVIKMLGKKRSIVFGNVLVIIDCLFYIFSRNMYGFIIGDFFGSLGFSLKSISEGSLLYTSLKKLDRKNEFSTIEGKSNSKYHYYDAISSVISGYLFIINNYLPLIFCLINLIVAFVISIKFTDVEEEIVENKNGRIRTKDILKSNRNKALFLCALVFAGLVAVSTKLYNAILIDLNLKEQYITIVLSIATIFTGVGSKLSNLLQNLLKNKALSILLIIYIISFFTVGIIGISNSLTIYNLSLYILVLIIMCIIQGGYRVAIKKYLFSFTTHFIRDKIISVYYIFEYIGQTIFLFIASFILNYYNNSVTDIIISLVFTIISIFIIIYMNGRVGLRPDEYEPTEINGYKIN